MVDSIRFDEDAKRELKTAKCFFDSINKGGDFMDDFENQIHKIMEMPLAFQIRYKKVRIIKFDNFPYTIHYTVTTKEIIVFNILNQFQKF